MAHECVSRIGVESAKATPSSIQIKGRLQRLLDNLSGWRVAVKICAFLTLLVFITNLSVTVWIAHWKNKDIGQTKVLYDGDCETAGQLSTFIHLLINSLSTILLASSNYCMQCLSAPTRKEVDEAHYNGQWLNIGVLSVRNLRSIPRKRAIMWFILGVSSVPLHLFYNSVVFTSISVNSYWPIPVTKNFLNTTLSSNYIVSNSVHVWDGTDDTYICEPWKEISKATAAEAIRMKQLWADGKLEMLDNTACINAYGVGYSTRGSVLMVLDDITSSNATKGGVDIFARFSEMENEESLPLGRYSSQRDGSWVRDSTTPQLGSSDLKLCPELIRNFVLPPLRKIDCRRKHASSWAIERTGTIQYCLSERVPEQCRVQASLPIAIVVIMLNLLKVIVMLIVAVSTTDPPLLCIGDGVASFLERSDAITRSTCLAARKDYKTGALQYPGRIPRVYASKKTRAFRELHTTHFAVLLILYGLIIIGVVFCVMYSVEILLEVGGDVVQVMKEIGMGKVSTWAMLAAPKTGVNGLVFNSCIANFGQLVISLAYVPYNRMFTIFSGAWEWESYAKNRKALRVTAKPRGEQRSTYFLSLPYRIAVPLLISSGVLHWLVSQAIFLVVLDYRAYDPRSQSWTTVYSESVKSNTEIGIKNGTFFRCGFSPLATIILLAAVFLMFIGLFFRGWWQLNMTMPVAGNCSAAIAAACHLPPGENGQETSISKVQWGATGYSDGGMGHCAFSMFEVVAPQEGFLYE